MSDVSVRSPLFHWGKEDLSSYRDLTTVSSESNEEGETSLQPRRLINSPKDHDKRM